MDTETDDHLTEEDTLKLFEIVDELADKDYLDLQTMDKYDLEYYMMLAYDRLYA